MQASSRGWVRVAVTAAVLVVGLGLSACGGGSSAAAGGGAGGGGAGGGGSVTGLKLPSQVSAVTATTN